MKFNAMSRMALCNYIDKLTIPTLVLSIHTYLDCEPSFLKEEHKNLVHAEFFEFNDEISDNPVLHAMTEEDAKRMVDTVIRWIPDVEQIIVHCDAGVSRSVGCIAAIKKYYTGDDNEFFIIGVPNCRCYNLVLSEFMERERSHYG